MTGTGRPLRFLLALVGIWIGVRAAYLWPEHGPVLMATAAPRTEAKIVARRRHGNASATITRAVAPSAAPGPIARRRAAPGSEPSAGLGTAAPAAGLARAQPLPAPVLRAAPWPAPDMREAPRAMFVAAPLPSADVPPSRVAASAWLIARGGSAAPLVPQLGGSQVGMRATLAIDAARRLSLAARVSSALGARQQEAAIGVDWRPTRLPIHLVAEQRIGLAGMRSGPAIGAVAGIGPTPVSGRLELDAYAQAGAIARRGGFIDGAVRFAHPIATRGRARLLLGAGAWGAAQRDASRVDVGPALTLATPLGGKLIRLELDWRQRIVGNAAPASGPALSIGTDF